MYIALYLQLLNCNRGHTPEVEMTWKFIAFVAQRRQRQQCCCCCCCWCCWCWCCWCWCCCWCCCCAFSRRTLGCLWCSHRHRHRHRHRIAIVNETEVARQSIGKTGQDMAGGTASCRGARVWGIPLPRGGGWFWLQRRRLRNWISPQNPIPRAEAGIRNWNPPCHW